MTTAVFDPRSKYELPEARAMCDGCRALGPPVECQAPKRKGGRDDMRAVSLACAVDGFFEVLEAMPGRRRGLFVRTYCRTCVEGQYNALRREHAAAVSAAVSKRGAMAMLALQATWDYQDRVGRMVAMRAYLGIPEVGPA